MDPEEIEALASKIALLFETPAAWSNEVNELGVDDQVQLAKQLDAFYGFVLDPEKVQDCRVLPVMVRHYAGRRVLINNSRGGKSQAKLFVCPICSQWIRKTVTIVRSRNMLPIDGNDDYVLVESQNNTLGDRNQRVNEWHASVFPNLEHHEKPSDFDRSRDKTVRIDFECRLGHKPDDWVMWAGNRNLHPVHALSDAEGDSDVAGM